MQYFQGDIVLVYFPSTDLQSRKKRPAVVVSSEDVNNSEDVILAAVTSNIRNDDFSFLLQNSDLTNPLPQISEVRCHKLFTCDQTSIIKPISKINIDGVLKALTRKVKTSFSTV